MSLRRRSLVTTLALLAAVLAYGAIRWGTERPGPPSARRASVLAVRPSVPAPPSARDVLEQGSRLGLRVDQQARLEALEGQWREQVAPLEAELEAATSEFSRFMEEAREGRGTSLRDIEGRTAAIGELSAALRERRRLHGAGVARVLEDWQRRQLAERMRPRVAGGDR